MCATTNLSEKIRFLFLPAHNLMIFSKHHRCDVCNKSFASKETLTNHMKSHTGNYNNCDQCDKKFVSERDLEDHMNVHTGNKVHKLDLSSN